MKQFYALIALPIMVDGETFQPSMKKHVVTNGNIVLGGQTIQLALVQNSVMLVDENYNEWTIEKGRPGHPTYGVPLFIEQALKFGETANSEAIAAAKEALPNFADKITEELYKAWFKKNVLTLYPGIVDKLVKQNEENKPATDLLVKSMAGGLTAEDLATAIEPFTVEFIKYCTALSGKEPNQLENNGFIMVEEPSEDAEEPEESVEDTEESEEPTEETDGPSDEEAMEEPTEDLQGPPAPPEPVEEHLHGPLETDEIQLD